MAARACFITGTDTGVGKTCMSLALIEVLKQYGCRVGAMKPVASGCVSSRDGLRNADAQLLQQYAGSGHDYETINPYALTRPSAPLVAARQDGIVIRAEPILDSFQKVSADTDIVLMEGVGGWQVQLNEDLWMSDVVMSLNLPVIMVVGMRLGCINHALLTAEAIGNNGCWLLGWIGNQVDPDYDDYEATLSLLSRTLAAPMIGSVPYIAGAGIENMSGFLNNICNPDFGLVDRS